MSLKFSKLEALGNDFMLVDARAQPWQPSASLIAQLGDRRRGIGFDQLLVLNAVARASDAHCEVAIHNQDGSGAEQCGNGMRAVACWLEHQGELGSGKTVLTAGGRVNLAAIGSAMYSAFLPPPSFEAEAVGHDGPVTWTHDDGGHIQHLVAVSMGNPHLVIFDQRGPGKDRLAELGQRFSPPGFWPAGANVNLGRVSNNQTIDLAVFERGVGPTPACGSGACATAAAAIHLGLAKAPLTVRQPGGELVIDWHPNAEGMTMTGPARLVFNGQFNEPATFSA